MPKVLAVAALAVATLVYPRVSRAQDEIALVWSVLGDTSLDCFGRSVARLGDVDGDSFDDFVVGAPKECPGGGALPEPGTVRIVSGRTGNLIRTVTGVAAGDLFGHAVAAIEDIDGDGRPDLLVGATGTTVAGTPSAGSLLAYSGASGALLYRVDGGPGGGFGDQLGYSIAAVGDIDLDGKEDFAVGAPTALNSLGISSGVVQVHSGADGSLLRRLEGTGDGDFYGASFAGISDLNGNGSTEVLVGAPYTSPPGQLPRGSADVRDPLTGVILRAFSGTRSGCAFGTATVGGLDFDQDGTKDIAIGSPCSFSFSEEGRVYVLSGATWDTLAEITGPGAAEFGATLAAGEFDGIGGPDLLVGAPWRSNATAVFHGAVFLYPSLSTTPTLSVEGSVEQEFFGSGLATVGDLTGSGHDGFIVGAPGGSPFDIPGAGIAYVYSLLALEEARGFYKGGNTIRAGANSDPVILQVEPVAQAFDPYDISGGSVVLRSYSGQFREIRAESSYVSGAEDTNRNGIDEARIAFSREDWRRFFAYAPHGSSLAVASLEGKLSGGRRFQADITLTVSVLPPVAAAVYPNPMRESTTMTLQTSVDGRLEVDLFDCRGRHVRNLHREANAPSGYHDIRIEAESGSGTPLSSGVYFYRVVAEEGTTTGRVVVVQ